MMLLPRLHAQQGFSLLVFSLMLLVLFSLSSAYLIRQLDGHQQQVSFAYRLRQAQALAESQLGMGAAHYQAVGADANEDGRVDGTLNSGLFSGRVGALSWQVRFCAAARTASDCPIPSLAESLRLITIVESTDSHIRYLQTLRIESRPVLPATPSDVLRYSRRQGELPRLTAPSGSVIPVPQESRSEDEVFQPLLGRPLAGMQLVADTHAVFSAGPWRWPEFARIVFISVPAGEIASLGDVVVGTLQAPVLLIVDGAVRLPAGATFHGLMVARQVTLGVGSLVYGAIACGEIMDTPSATIVYQPEILAKVAALPVRSVVATSWRDWRE